MFSARKKPLPHLTIQDGDHYSIERDVSICIYINREKDNGGRERGRKEGREGDVLLSYIFHRLESV